VMYGMIFTITQIERDVAAHSPKVVKQISLCDSPHDFICWWNLPKREHAQKEVFLTLNETQGRTNLVSDGQLDRLCHLGQA